MYSQSIALFYIIILNVFCIKIYHHNELTLYHEHFSAQVCKYVTAFVVIFNIWKISFSCNEMQAQYLLSWILKAMTSCHIEC